jgi:crotonobetainyl-CoA:carnitine CoA-transferase CaiB-like acyl-CoA transferase
MRPLEGIKVVDFSHALAGPLCTYHLGLLGADVIKIERPGIGDDLRLYTEHTGKPGMSAPFVAANAGKRSIVLDLKHPEARTVITELVRQGDVVLENFRPGVPKKLGLDWDSLSAINPKLVYCSVTGFGQTGPLRDWTAYDHIVQAMSGIMWLNGEPEQGPLKVGLPFSDTFAGYVASYAILAALMQRTRSGTGQFIDVGMLDATLVLLAQGIAVYQMSGQTPIRTGNRGYRLVATADTYQTHDGYLAIGANHQHQWEALCRVLGAAELLSDARFADHALRVKHGAELRDLLAAVFAQSSAAELEEKLAQAQVPAAMVRDIPGILRHPHVAARDAMVKAAIPGYDAPLPLAGAGFRFAHDGPRREAAVPKLGEHTEAILGELGYDKERITAMRAAGLCG